MLNKEQQAEKNLKLYTLIKVVSKRFYLPLISIYFVDVGNITIEQLGIFLAIGAFIQLILEVPSGYFADKFSRNLSYAVVGIGNFIGVMCYILFQNPTGIFIGILLENISFAFFSGVGPAIVKESLEVLDREKELSKVLTRAQSKSLFINALLVITVPLTYAIDERLPFIAGALQYLVLGVAAFLMKDLRNTHEKEEENFNKKWLTAHKSYLLFAVFFGLIAALYTAPSGFKNLVHQANDIPPEYLGLLFGASNLIGAAIGVYIYKLKYLGIKTYVVLDCLILFIGLALFVPQSAISSTAGFLLAMAWWRYRGVMYSDFILEAYSTNLKSTLLSVGHNFAGLHGIWIPIAIGSVVASNDLYFAFSALAIFSVIAAPLFILSAIKELDKPRS